MPGGELSSRQHHFSCLLYLQQPDSTTLLNLRYPRCRARRRELRRPAKAIVELLFSTIGSDSALPRPYPASWGVATDKAWLAGRTQGSTAPSLPPQTRKNLRGSIEWMYF